MVVLGIVAYTKGNPYKLLNSVDSEGNICGYDAKVIDRPKLVFFDLTQCIASVTTVSTKLFGASCPTKQLCAKKCPDQNALGFNVKNISDLVCDYDIDLNNFNPSQSELIDLIREKRCAPYYLKSSDLLNRCIPTVVGDAVQSAIGESLTSADGTNVTSGDVKEGSLAVQALLNLQNLGQQIIKDVQQSWYLILAGLGIAMVASFLYIIVMRWIAGLLVWLTIYMILTALGFSVYYSWTKYTELKANGGNSTSTVLNVATGLDTYINNERTWYWLTIILGVILGILVLILLALYKRISIAIQVIKEGSRAISHIPFALFFPVIPWLLQLILFAWFVGVLVFLVTAGDAEFQVVSNDTENGVLCTQAIKDAISKVADSNKTCNFVDFANNDHLFRMQVYHLFGWFWIMNFIMALGMCALAGAFASYYWAWDKKTDIPKFAVTASFYRTLRYHTGSLAFGSLIIAIVQLIRAGLEYLDHKLRGGPGEQSEITKYLIKCLKCCFWCLEKFLKFLNKNAYIMIAVHGKNFCTSAKNAFFLLMRNIVRVVVLDKVTDFILFLGQLTITAGLGIGSFYWFERQDNLNYYLAPVIIIAVGAYVVSAAFFSVYSMAIDTVFLSFLEDSERNDGSPEKPYYMSKSLRKIIGKKNKKASDSD
ncbi:hypothetical protein OS493_014823 [Desmophyllum pertusum]|uniref:Choline transporter-like protein n=1 Tax=Desmophyllum pertusum TaxID=174260 RepID=A0A9W9YGQ0_9CNID|nr:hypothetical protein OS493_014823 [Desmophyllum pertusum]